MMSEACSSNIHDVDARAALERFVVDNDDLQDLESRIGKFNIFDALGITRVEIRHSNFLAFILDPIESHGQGQVFLKAILMDLVKKALPDSPISPIELDGEDLRGVVVKREWEHIDLLITCQNPRFVVVIENKVDSQDHSGQLLRYEQTIKKYYPQHRSIYVFLTPTGDGPIEEPEENWLPYSYSDIYRVLKRNRDIYEKAIGDEVLVFLDHYLHLLRNRFMDNKELDELCQRIYKNHRQALDLIWERAGTTASGLMAEVVKVIEQDRRWRVVHQNDKVINCVPSDWFMWLPALGSMYDDPRIWMAFRFERGEDRLFSLMHLQGMQNEDLRTKIGEAIIKEAPKYGLKQSKARRVAGGFTTMTGAERIKKWSEDEEPDFDEIRKLVKERLDDMFPKLERLGVYLKSLCETALSTKPST